jgi:hypothetical protein
MDVGLVGFCCRFRGYGLGAVVSHISRNTSEMMGHPAFVWKRGIKKAAHADVGSAAWQEIRVALRFRPTYALANVGHPSSSSALFNGWKVRVRVFA